MNEAQLYESLGRKQADIECRAMQYARLLALLGQVCSGEIEACRVRVDLATQSWTLAPASTESEATAP